MTPLDPNAKYRFVMTFVFYDVVTDTETTVIKLFRFLSLTEQQLNENLWWADHGGEVSFMAALGEIEWTYGKHSINADKVEEIEGYDTDEVSRENADTVMQKWGDYYRGLGLVLGPVETMSEEEYKIKYRT